MDLVSSRREAIEPPARREITNRSPLRSERGTTSVMPVGAICFRASAEERTSASFFAVLIILQPGHQPSTAHYTTATTPGWPSLRTSDGLSVRSWFGHAFSALRWSRCSETSDGRRQMTFLTSSARISSWPGGIVMANVQSPSRSARPSLTRPCTTSPVDTVPSCSTVSRVFFPT